MYVLRNRDARKNVGAETEALSLGNEVSAERTEEGRLPLDFPRSPNIGGARTGGRVRVPSARPERDRNRIMINFGSSTITNVLLLLILIVLIVPTI